MLPKTIIPFIWHFVRRQKYHFLLITVISIYWGISDTIFPYILKHIINVLENFTGDRATIFHSITALVILLLTVRFLAEILNRIQGITSIYTFPYFRANIREAVFNYVKSHSHDYFSRHFAGNIGQKLADLPHSCQMIMEISCYQLVTALTGSTFVLVTAWLAKPLFAIILMSWLCLHLGITYFFLHRGNLLWETHSEAVTNLGGKIIDAFTNMLSVRIFARGFYEAQYLKPFQQDEIAKAKKAMWQIETMHICLGINSLFLILTIVLTLINGWVHRSISIGDFTQITMQMFWLLGWIWFISFQLTVFTRELGVINNALELIRKGHDLRDHPDAKSIVIKQGKIQFINAQFSYRKKQLVFQNLNVLITPGQRVGLVGFSGSGKTTFVNLILRFYDLGSGQILIDDHDIAQVTQDSLRSQIAMIPQDPSLFHRSIIDNIRYGRLDATDEEVIQAAKLAHCHEFIEQLPQQYQTLVGERGAILSGGQRQRIAIARAILKNAPVLILDEATSALDTITEKVIQESLQNLMQNRTTIVIAHRLSTLADMDRILVFHKGKIVEDGTMQELLRQQQYFAKLWTMQTNGFLPENSGELQQQFISM